MKTKSFYFVNIQFFRYILLALLVVTFGCEQQRSNRKKVGKYWVEIVGSYDDGVEKRYSLEGRLVSETPFKDSKPHGLKKEFYIDGKIFKETPCDMGVVNGMVKEYYQSGGIKSETPTNRGKVDGVKKLYYEDGSLKAEASFSKGKVTANLKEYDRQGKVIAPPKLLVKGIDQTILNGGYLVELSISNGKKKVRYELITTIDGKEVPIRLTTEDGKAFYTESIPKGDIVMKKLVFQASFKTDFGNTCILRETYTLAVSRK